MSGEKSHTSSSSFDPEMLDRMRRSVPFRMDRMGNFFVGEEPITHPRIIQVMRNGLDMSENGEATMHVDQQWCFLKVEDCFFRALHVENTVHPNLPGKDDLLIDLDDGRKVLLDLASLWEEPHQGLRCQAPSRISGRPLSVRFRNAAQMEIAQWISWQQDEPQLILRDGIVSILSTPPGDLRVQTP